MADILFTEFAEDDLAEINPASAAKLLNEFYQKFLLISDNSKMGRSHDEFIVNLRSFPHKKYIIFYFPTERGIEVFRVLQDARDIEDLFDRYFIGLKP